MHSLPAASFMEWRQDVVVEASSGVVHASFQVYQDQKQAGSAVLVSYRPLALSQPSHFFGAPLAVRTPTAQKKVVTVMLSSHRGGCSHALQ